MGIGSVILMNSNLEFVINSFPVKSCQGDGLRSRLEKGLSLESSWVSCESPEISYVVPLLGS